MNVQRRIIHVDMDAFYASVEQRDYPELQGIPIAVGGAGGRGVVTTCSYEARAFGVRSAMPGKQALRLCPHIKFVPPRFEAYKEASAKIRSIFEVFTPLIEPLSLDEAYLDVTSNPKGLPSARAIALAIRDEIQRETGLTASAGISYCKFLAKIASDMNKPNGQTIIRPSEAEHILENLPIRKFFGIGAATAEAMERVGIHTGKDLKSWSMEALQNRFGKAGAHFYNIVRGLDDRPVKANRKRKSISIEDTFPEDIIDPERLQKKARTLAYGLWDRVKASDFPGRSLQLKIKYFDFQLVTRSQSFPQPFQSQSELVKSCLDLAESNLSPPAHPVRLIGFGVFNPPELSSGPDPQLSLQF